MSTNNKIHTSHILEKYVLNQYPMRARPTGLALIQMFKKIITNQHKHKTTYTHQISRININQLTHTYNIDPKNINNNKQWYKTCEIQKPPNITQARYHTITLKIPTPNI